MIDGFVLLTPLLLLPFVLLFAFLGCQGEFEARSRPAVIAVLRFGEMDPQGFSRVKFRWTVDGEDAGDEVAGETDEGFEYRISPPPAGQWVIFCSVYVGANDDALGEVPSSEFTVEEGDVWTVEFAAVPAEGGFQVEYVRAERGGRHGE